MMMFGRDRGVDHCTPLAETISTLLLQYISVDRYPRYLQKLYGNTGSTGSGCFHQNTEYSTVIGSSPNDNDNDHNER